MKEKLGAKRLGTIGLPKHNHITSTTIDQKDHPSLTQAFGIWYDIQIKVAASNDPVVEARQKFMELL